MIERLFQLREKGTSVRTEVIAGLTTFMTMAYIIFVNPIILSDAGMNFGAVMTATALTAGLATIFMGLYAKYPFALASGMGLNAFFAYVVAAQAGWQTALGCVFISGILFLILSVFNVVNYIDAAVPTGLKRSVSVGIGLFIAFIGLKSAEIVVANPATIVSLGNLTEPGPLLSVIGLVVIGILMARRVRGAMLIGILITTIIGVPLGVVSLSGFKLFGMPASLAPIAFQLDIRGALTLGVMTLFAFLFVDLFDTLGTLMGTAARANMLDDRGRLPRIKQAMIVDAVATVGGALLGTSTVTSYVESASGVAEGGRSGLTATVVGILFLLSLFLAPLVGIVPAQATAPALVIVGVLMMGAIAGINFEDFTEAFPAFVTILVMPLAFSIADGIAAGFIVYPIVKVAAGRGREVHPFVWVLTVISIIHFAPSLMSFL